MQFGSCAERMFIEEVMQSAKKAKLATKGLGIGDLIRALRKQLGISQKALGRRCKVNQSTICRIEQGKRCANIFTLKKILKVISCEVLVVPVLEDSIENIRRKQARRIAKKHIHYLKGAMNLENQKLDPEFLKELINKEEEIILRGPKFKLWDEKR